MRIFICPESYSAPFIPHLFFIIFFFSIIRNAPASNLDRNDEILFTKKKKKTQKNRERKKLEILIVFVHL
jgi:hypothetical protein